MKSKRRFKLLTFSLMLVVIGATVFVMTLRTTTSARAASVPTGLHVVGNKIEDSSGHVFIPRGVDRMGGEYSCPYGNTFDGPVDQASVSAMLSWDITTVRLPMNEDCWLGINGYPAGGLSVSQYQQQFVNYVNLLNQNGIVVIIDLHWNNSGGNKATGQENMADLDHAPAFWTSVANRFKSNSSVIFDLYNEPHDISWSCWKNGSTSAYSNPCSGVGFAVAGMQTLVNAVRATGATNILMLGGVAWSNDLSGWLANKPSDPKNELAASTHIYNFNSCSNTSCWDSQLAPVLAQVPLIPGEIGSNNCSSSSFMDSVMSWMDQHSTGYVAWAWYTSGCPSLLSNYNGTPAGYGQDYKNHLISVANSGGSGGGGGGSGPYYKIVNRNSGQVLDITGYSTANGALAIQWPYDGGANQQWQEVSVNGGYKLVNRNSGLLFEDSGWSKATGTQMDQWSDGNGSNQWWNLVSAGSGYYYLVNQYSGLYADVSGYSTANGAAVIQWTKTGGSNQQWQVIAV